jgi:hypothetical protein
MKKTTIKAALAALAISATSVAAWAASGYPQGTPTAVWAGFSNKSVYVMGLSNTAQCSSSTIHFNPSWTDADKIERLATAALLSGRNLECYVNGCSGSYQKGYDCKLQ